VATRPSRPGRTLIIFFLAVAAMYAGVIAAGSWAPRLGLDLQGGTRITLSASTQGGNGGVTPAKMSEAVNIIRNRVNGTGVTEAEVTTQGGSNIIVEIPGQQRKDIVDEVGKTAQLRFRLVAPFADGTPNPVAGVDLTQPTTTGSATGSPTGPTTWPILGRVHQPALRRLQRAALGRVDRTAFGWRYDVSLAAAPARQPEQRFHLKTDPRVNHSL